MSDCDVTQMDEWMSQPDNRGRIVKTKTGKIGIVYNSDEMVGEKIKVHCYDGNKLLCKPETLEVIGYTD